MFFACSFLAVSGHYAHAQISLYEGIRACGVTEETPSYAPESAPNFCFDVDEIQESCIKAWIRINLHFFLDDNCEGTLDPLGIQNIPGDDAYELAEDIIKRANDALENNYKQWVQDTFWGIQPEDIKEAQCIPLRYVLSGVHVWCNTVAQDTSGFKITYFQDNFGQNTDTEYNAYFVDLPGDANGAANGEPGNAFSAESFGVGVFNHEMGHVLGIEHSFFDDDLDDTPQVGFRYDYNCDGDTTDTFPSPGVGWEGRWRQCHDNLLNPEVAYDRSLDYDGDMMEDYPDLCDMPSPCLPYPCCSWLYINNNIMSYSRYTECCAAYTEGQITRILENLSTNTYCAYIEEITGYPHGFQPGETYTAVLKMENYCGDEAQEVLIFTFEEVECDEEDPGHRIAITGKYPNPFSGTLQVDFTTEEAGYLEIWLVPAAGGPDVLAHSEYLASPGSYQKNLSTSQVSAGTHYLALCLDGETIAETVIKQ